MGLPEEKKPDAHPADVQGRGRGRQADEPHEVPKEGWKDILSRTVQSISGDNLTIVAAGVGFYAFVAVVPSLAALIGIYGLVFDPAQVGEQITSLATVLPRDVLPMLEEQLKRITSNTEAASASTIVGLLLTLWSSSAATKALIQGLNIAYGEKETRSFVRLNAMALLLTVGIIAGAILAISLVAVIPAVLQAMHLGGTVETVLNWARWPILLGGFIAALSILYRYAPCRQDAKWSWVSWGAATAAVLWLLASGLFSLYVSRFGSYDKTYGSLAAIVVFLMWLYISAFTVLLGAELNSEMERQTVKDTTDGAPKPLGGRGAYSADTVGPARASRDEKDKARPPNKQRSEPRDSDAGARG